MSITTARNFIEKTGCGLIVGIGLAVVIVFGLYSFWGGSGASGGPREIPPEMLRPVATVGAHPITIQAVERRYRIQSTQQRNTQNRSPILMDGLIYAGQLDGLLQQAARLELAGKRGIDVSDDEIIDFVTKNFDDRVNQMRDQYKQFGIIKADATEAEIQKVLAPNFGGDIAKARTETVEAAKLGIEDPTLKPEYRFAALSQKLSDAYSAQVQVTDDELKKAQYKTVFKRISLKVNEGFTPMSATEIKEREEVLHVKAAKILSEIKGGLSFEAAMEKYSDDPAPAGKKKSDSTVDLQHSVLSFDEDYKPLMDLKPGEVSPVIFHAIEAQFQIFKAIRIDTTLPKDFESKKADYKKNRVTQIAAQKIKAEADKLSDAGAVKWASSGFRALHKWYKTFNDMDLIGNSAKRLSEYETIAAEAKKVNEESDPVGNRAAALAYYLCLDPVYRAASAEKKKAMAPEWAEAATAVLENVESSDLRIELARTYLDLDKPDEAVENVAAAAQANAGLDEEAFGRYKNVEELRKKLIAAGIKEADLKEIASSQEFWADDAVETLKGEAENNLDYSETGRTKFGEINKQLASLKALGLIKPEDVKIVEDFQNKWKVEKVKYDDEQAKARKKAAEDAKKAAAETKKKADEAKKAGTKPSTGTTGTTSGTPPNSSNLGTTGSSPSNPLTGSTAGKTGG